MMHGQKKIKKGICLSTKVVLTYCKILFASY